MQRHSDWDVGDRGARIAFRPLRGCSQPVENSAQFDQRLDGFCL
jgi:hypothetical protein